MAMVYKCDRCGKYYDDPNEGGGQGPFVWDGTMSKDQENADLCKDCYNSLVQWWDYHKKEIRILDSECATCKYSNQAEHMWPCNHCSHNCSDHWEAKNDGT